MGPVKCGLYKQVVFISRWSIVGLTVFANLSIYLEMQLPHPRHNALFALHIILHGESWVFPTEARDPLGEIVHASLVHWLDGH